MFKVKGTLNQTLFIDLDCHAFEKWSDYLDSNRLPNCLYCYPRDGLYQSNDNKVLVDFVSPPGDNTVTSVYDKLNDYLDSNCLPKHINSNTLDFLYKALEGNSFATSILSDSSKYGDRGINHDINIELDLLTNWFKINYNILLLVA